jgi:tetratricopeptide (TPR) repeat protein
MATCFTCGSSVDGFAYTCPTCVSMMALTGLRDDVAMNSLDGAAMTAAQMAVFSDMQKTLAKGLSEMATAIQWGFTELSWQVSQQTDVLKRIDETLQTPSETQANEFRRMAEELLRREVFDEAKEFFIKSLTLNRLDYRTYVGLANVLLRRGAYREALETLEKSLPHAPAEGEAPITNWRSFSLRLIGRIHSCLGDLKQAEARFAAAFRLSPEYADVAYDLAVVRAQHGNGHGSIQALRSAIQLSPLYWYLPQRQRAFMPIEKEVRQLLVEMRDDARRAVRSTFDEAEHILIEARPQVAELISRCDKWHLVSLTDDTLHGVQDATDAFAQVSKQFEQVGSGLHATDYKDILEAIEAARVVREEAIAVKRQLRQAVAKLEEEQHSTKMVAYGLVILFVSVMAITLIIIGVRFLGGAR